MNISSHLVLYTEVSDFLHFHVVRVTRFSHVIRLLSYVSLLVHRIPWIDAARLNVLVHFTQALNSK